MLKILSTALLGALLLTSTIAQTAKAEDFPQPSFTGGTNFVLHYENSKGKTWRRNFTFQKKTSDVYILGRMKLSQSLELRQKNRSFQGRHPVQFPLSFNKKWKYQRTFTSPYPECGQVTTTMTATAGGSFEKFTVAGEELDVVSIQHEGTWSGDCGDGRQVASYLYSPRLQMFVKEVRQNYRPNGSINSESSGTMTSFSIPQAPTNSSKNLAAKAKSLEDQSLTGEQIKSLFVGNTITWQTRNGGAVKLFYEDASVLKWKLPNGGTPETTWSIKDDAVYCHVTRSGKDNCREDLKVSTNDNHVSVKMTLMNGRRAGREVTVTLLSGNQL